jgi:hypothetical protein
MKIPKPFLYLGVGLFIAATLLAYRYKEENQELRERLQEIARRDTEGSSKLDSSLRSGKSSKIVVNNGNSAETDEFTSIRTVPPNKTLRRFLLGKFKQNGGYLRLNVFDGEGNITDAFAELYGLSDWEIEALTAESAKAREQHFQLATAHSDISPMEDGGTRVVLNPYESDENIYADVLDSFQRVLGDDRFTDFLDLGEAEMRNKFNQFGAEKLVVEVVPKTEMVEGPDGQPIEVTNYSIVETKERADQKSSRSLHNIGEDYFSKEFDLIKRLIDDEETKP